MSSHYHPFHDDPDYYEGRAFGLRSVHDAGQEPAPAIVARLLPARDPARPLSEDEARLVVARQHGSEDWAGLMARVAALDGDPFREAYLAVEHDDAAALAAQLDREPWLVRARGTNGNDLLGMAGSLEVMRLLLARGADPARANDKGWTPLHQAAYGNRVRAARLLLEAGAPVAGFGHGEGGTPLVAALFWGHREVAEVLAEHGTPPGNLRVAAGLGRLEEIGALAPGGAQVTPSAGAARGFYRPHSGFPPWQPADSPQEVLDEALAWAARSDRAEALSLLVERGAAVDADVYRGTALTWAAACGRVAAIERLVALGAGVNRRGTFGGPDHGEGATALHLAAQAGHAGAARALLAAGADASIEDRLHGGNAASWAEFGCHPELAAELRAAAE